jgi:hypothetical protein
MKRQLFSIATVLCLCAGCATQHPSAAQALVSKINRDPGYAATCAFGEVRYCEADVDRQEHCTCTDHHTLFGPQSVGGYH